MKMAMTFPRRVRRNLPRYYPLTMILRMTREGFLQREKTLSPIPMPRAHRGHLAEIP
jgi:hypothetical protein